MKRCVFLITFVIIFLLLVSFLSIDTCMDVGGLWSNLGITCKGVPPDFVPLYKRTTPFFWLIVILLSITTSFSITRLMPSSKP